MPDELSLQVEHDIPGRVRVRCAGLKEDPSIAERISALAQGLPGLEEASIRPQTGSVVFRYSLEETTPHHFIEALRSRAHVHHRGRTRREAPMPVGAEMIHAVRRFWTHTDHRMQGASGGRVDLKSSLPWLFMLLGVRQYFAHPEVPSLPWYTAFYHSVQTIFLYQEEEKPPNTPEDEALMDELAHLTEGE